MLQNATVPNKFRDCLLPECENPVLKDLILQMVQGNPGKRITPPAALQFIQSRFFNIVWVQYSNKRIY